MFIKEKLRIRERKAIVFHQKIGIRVGGSVHTNNGFEFNICHENVHTLYYYRLLIDSNNR